MGVSGLIRRKIEGLSHSPGEISSFLMGYLKGSYKDYHVAAWLTAAFQNGLNTKETNELTEVLWKSGATLPRVNSGQYWIDKHSTGGVGDKTSMILVPLVLSVASKELGGERVKLPMISGRSLGHTGGTLDKLESVPGFKVDLSIDEALRLLNRNDSFIMGQTAQLAPLDKSIYALRDSIGVVDHPSFIVSSIMSKKLAENLNGIVFDVKVGEGSILPEFKQAKKLAKALIEVSKSQGLDAIAVLTAMDEPLGWAVGNFIEMEECWEYLSGERRDPGLHAVVLELAGHMIHLASRKKLSPARAKQLCELQLNSKTPCSLFERLLDSQGGNLKTFQKHRSSWREQMEVALLRAPSRGVLARLSAKKVGEWVASLGAARQSVGEAVDPFVGIEILRKCGDPVEAGEPILKVFHRGDAKGLESMEASMFKVTSNFPQTIWVKEILR